MKHTIKHECPVEIPALDDALSRLDELESKVAQQSASIAELFALVGELQDGATPTPEPEPEPDPEPNPEPEPEPEPSELQNLAAVGVSADRWVTQPSEITFVPEMQSDAGGLRIGRLFVPRDGNWGSTYHLRRSPRGPHHLALLAIKDNDDTLNQQARDQYLAGDYGYVYGPFNHKERFARILALDWIKWESEEQFESVVAPLIAQSHDWWGKNESLPGSGYYDNDAYLTASAWMLETMLVAICHGRPGPSGQWAAERLTHMSEEPNLDTWLMSPYEVANVLTLQSKHGGGRENCPDPINAVGGYEQYFITGGLLLWAWDTATGSSLFADNLYFQTRADGFALEHDTNVEKRGAGTIAMRMLACHANMTGDGKTAWMVGKRIDLAGNPTLLEFDACSGPRATEQPPESEVQVRKAGSLWHYHENPADADNAFRVAISCRDLSHYRCDDWDRCFGFAYKGVGLVMGGSEYRGQRVPLFANGLDLHGGSEDHNGHVAPYWSSRATRPETVATDPRYLIQQGGPELVNGLYVWNQDWTHLVNAGGLTKVVTQWQLDPVSKSLTITDTVEHDGLLTPRLCFSPNYLATFNGDSFDITDGSNTVRVSVIPSETATWDRSTPVPQKYNVGRIAEIVTVTPAPANSHTFTTFIEVV